MAGTVREPALSSAHLLVVTVSDEIEHDTNSKKKLHTLKENACSMAVGARGVSASMHAARHGNETCRWLPHVGADRWQVPGVHVTLVRFCTERPKSAETAAEPAASAGSREDYSWPLLTPDMLHAADGIVVGEVDGCADLRYSQPHRKLCGVSIIASCHQAPAAAFLLHARPLHSLSPVACVGAFAAAASRFHPPYDYCLQHREHF